jgi:DNA-binding MarR family transcriptional regulator
MKRRRQFSRAENRRAKTIYIDISHIVKKIAVMNTYLTMETRPMIQRTRSLGSRFDKVADDSHLLTERKEFEEISERAAYSAIIEILAAAKRVRQKLAPAKGISFDEFRILLCLQSAEEEGLFVIQENLVQELGLSPSRISTILNTMDASLPFPECQAGRVTSRPWIKRTDDPACRVQKLLFLTEEGKKVLGAARPGYLRQISKAVEAVGLGNLVQLRVVLKHLNGALDFNHTRIDHG